ncbi:MAG TPA: FliH/SctL family protein [Bryobacteraceae bacterium]|nr:FliH/SctL family protein [Bryobacteraceae bacterium]
MQDKPGSTHGPQEQPADAAQLHSEIVSLRAELQSARAEGERRVQEALASGRRDGDESARQLFEKQLEIELSKLRQMTRDLATSGTKLRRQAEEDLVRLSVAIARRILHRELTIDPDALAGLVKAAFERLDQREIQQLRTDPASITTVRKLVEGLDLARSIKVIADPSLRPGSLQLETTRGQLDASIETQLNEIERGFIDIVHHS